MTKIPFPATVATYIQSLIIGAAFRLLIFSTGQQILPGKGAPTITLPSGSIWLRTDGSTGARVYVSAGGGTWNAVAGV